MKAAPEAPRQAPAASWRPQLDETSAVPLYEQLIEQVSMAITARFLRPGDPLPSVRGLAAELRINPNTASRAVREMTRLGLAQSERGQGSVVADTAVEAALPIAERTLARELGRAVRVARGLGMTRKQLQDALRQAWEE